MKVRSELRVFRLRARTVFLSTVAALFILLVLLAELQIVEGSKWKRLAENNRLRRIPVAAPRGRIFDRSGVLLADNRPAWQLLIFPDEADDLEATAAFLDRQGILDGKAVREALLSRRVGTMAPLVLADNLEWEQVARIRSHRSDFPELSIVEGFRRTYPLGAETAHTVGYLRRMNPEDSDDGTDYQPDRLIGATGIERLGEELLRGHDGERRVVVSAVGNPLGLIGESLPIPGSDLAVTLDVRIQKAAVEALGQRPGAIVVMDVETGAIRALYSSPSFDPNIFSSPLTTEEWARISKDPLHPLQNRCLQGTYPPGSTIKPFMALAGIEQGLINPSWSVYCRGSVTLYGHTFRCWRRGGHGTVDLERALEVSCDVFFYRLGQKLGIENMASWIHRFGFGRSTGLMPVGEADGLIGTPEWSRLVRKTPWYPGESVSVSIGQGPFLVTAVQLARGFALLANGGRLIRPFLIPPESPEPPIRIDLEPTGFAAVLSGLKGVVHSSEGTARVLAGLPVAGKTGTAQVVRLPEPGQGRSRSPELQHHAWFVGWAPIENPRFSIAVLVEHGGGGGSVAAPTAAVVFRAALGLPPENRQSSRDGGGAP